MANIFRAPGWAPGIVRRFVGPDVLPNVLLTFISAVGPQPIGQDNLQDPYTARRYFHQDFSLTGVTTRGIPNPKPFITVSEDLNPTRKPYQQQEQVPNLPTSILPSAGTTFRLPLYTEINRDPRARDYLTFETTVYLPSVNPTVINRLPLYTQIFRKADKPQDFAYNGTLILPVVPFNQDDWPLFARSKALTIDHLQGSIQNLGIPAKTVLPFNQSDWPLFLPRRQQYSESVASPQILLTTITRPFFQTDQPNPYRFRIVPQDFQQSGFYTRQVVVPPFAQTDFPNPYKALITPQAWIEQGFTTRGIPPAVIPPPPPGFIVMPNLIGLGWLHASHVIIQLKLIQLLPPDRELTYVFPPYTVVGQEPPAGTYVALQTAVKLTVTYQAHLLGATFDTIPLFG